MTIDTWMPTLRTNIQAVSGIKRAYKYDQIPHKLSGLPAAVILPVSGEQEYSEGGQSIAIHNIQITVYVTAAVIPKALGDAVPLIEGVRDALAADIQLGGNCIHCLPSSPFYDGPGAIPFGETALIGVVFNVVVKENETGSFAVSR